MTRRLPIRPRLRAPALPVAALATALAATAVIAAPAAAQAPSLRLVAASLRQHGDALQFGLRFDRAVPAADLQPRRGRSLCVLLSPARPSRRRVCVAHDGGRLRASIASIDGSGAARGPSRRLRGARVAARGSQLVLRASARALRVHLGRSVEWRVALRWNDGTGCALAPAGCLQLVPAAGTARTATRAPRRPAFTRLRRLRLLATGDSMIQIIDTMLERRLERRPGVSVRSDARIGTGVTKPAQLDWTRLARGQAADLKPDVTVVFLGANDGFPLRARGGARADCCDEAWVDAYARRVAAMMRSYLRGGRSYVYWLTLPAPRRDSFVRVYARVNAAIRRAAGAVSAGVRVIELARVFTPGWRFRQRITFRGRTVNARQGDGVHLSVAGAAVAATLIVDRLRADRALP